MNSLFVFMLFFYIWPIYFFCKKHQQGWGEIENFFDEYSSRDRLVAALLFAGSILISTFPSLFNNELIGVYESGYRRRLLPIFITTLPCLAFCLVVFKHVINVDLLGGAQEDSNRGTNYEPLLSAVGLTFFGILYAIFIFY